MCGKAVKLQEGWEPTDGDLFIGWADHDMEKLSEAPDLWMVGETLWGDPVMPKRSASVCICLFRQDQLQGMVWDLDTWSCKFQGCWGWYVATDTLSAIKSMEQLWLGFVMWDKYNKTWNGEDWIKA